MIWLSEMNKQPDRKNCFAQDDLKNKFSSELF